ncbi:hypothetical protein [Paenibacillus sp. NRS-1760]|uniref:hypothetical protein n=1 Tax=Paenibacillus sp. NRS-1760 TaxID=3233902 RepID=UPI003D293198
MDDQQKIELMKQMIAEKTKEREILKNQLDSIQLEMKQVDISINAFQNELVKLTGEKIILKQLPIRGAEIGEAAIEALRRLGGTAHYNSVKEEIEKFHFINGANEKSKADSVWNQLNKSDMVEKIGRGEFRLKVSD